MTSPANRDSAGASPPARRLIVGLWSVVLAVAWAALSVHPDYGSDTFFHLTLGREVLRTHSRMVTERWALPGMHDHCAVPAWLWDVGVFCVHRAWGWTGIGALIAALAALSAWACCRIATLRDGRASAASIILVTATISPLVLGRLQERPETAAMALVPCLLLAARGLVADSGRTRAAHAVLVVALVAVWVQVHTSFLLAPLLVAVACGDRLLRVDRRLAAGLAVALAATLLTNTHGAAIFMGGIRMFFADAARESGGYSATHITEWSAPTSDMLDPTRHVFLPLYVALWVAALVGAARVGPAPRRELALALVGLGLVVRAQRNFGVGAELLVPFAVHGVDGLFAWARTPRLEHTATLASLAVATWLLLRLASMLDLSLGPLGAVGPAEARAPTRSIALLGAAPAGTRVMTTYDAGAAIAFWLDGHIRTSLDSRVPLYFDDPEYAAARASWTSPAALDRALRLYAFDAAVIDRRLPICEFFAARKDWEPVVVERVHTTFARKGTNLGTPPLHLSPCGDERFTKDACGDGGAALARELEGDDPFSDYLRVESRIRCAQGSIDADALIAALPPRTRSAGFLDERDGVLAWILAHAGHVDEALKLVSPYVADGDVDAAARVAFVLEERRDTRLRPLLEGLVKGNAEAALPRWVYALLANSCAREAKLDCAATYGMFAAASGEALAAPALCTVSRQAFDPVTRKEARDWLGALAPGRVPAELCP